MVAIYANVRVFEAVVERGIDHYLRCRRAEVMIVAVVGALKTTVVVINIVNIKIDGSLVQDGECGKGVILGILQVILRIQIISIESSS
ncbi:MAG: hypothetical protein GY696_00845 [Gammaproteobacteria bacterium]|nr:hypothetical protein [Gammaproteobacteria bacterium]